MFVALADLQILLVEFTLLVNFFAILQIYLYYKYIIYRRFTDFWVTVTDTWVTQRQTFKNFPWPSHKCYMKTFYTLK